MRRLRPGSRIAVVAPSGPVPRDRFERGAARLGGRYQLIYSDRIFSQAGFLAGSDAERLHELNLALADATVDAVWCARGGYGLMRILPNLELEALLRDPKPVLGFSDVTALHARLDHEGLPSLHAPVITHLAGLPEEDIDSVIRLAEGTVGTDRLTGLSTMVSGWATGRLIGGNLELITRMLGTPYSFDPRGAILFFEEVSERPYRIDRQLTHLELAGWFSQLGGIVVGSLHQCGDEGSTPSALDVVRERLSRLTIPVVWNAPIGHADRNRAVPIGAKAELDADKGTLTISNPYAPTLQ